jgi:hypothetical protein
MILIIEYNKRNRIVLFLGESDQHFYCLASERIPESLAIRLKDSLSNLPSLKAKLDFVKDKYPALYKIALRSFSTSRVKIIKKYE